MRNHYRYIRVRDGIEIIASDARSGSIAIPKIYEGNPVVGIGDGVFLGCADITGVSIASGIQWIGSRAFADCPNLSYVELPDTLLWIEEEAFQGCKALKNVEFPGSLIRLGDKAFADCGSLEKAILPEGIDSLGIKAFENCISLERATLPAHVWQLPEDIFDGCDNLKEIRFQGDETRIINGAFSRLPALQQIYIPTDHAAYTVRGGAVVERLGKTLICIASRGMTNYVIQPGIRRIGQHGLDGI